MKQNKNLIIVRNDGMFFCGYKEHNLDVPIYSNDISDAVKLKKDFIAKAIIKQLNEFDATDIIKQKKILQMKIKELETKLDLLPKYEILEDRGE